FEQEERGDAPGHVAHFVDFGGREVAAEHSALAVAEPLLDYLIAAYVVAPHARGDVAPVADLIQIHVEGLLAESPQRLTFRQPERRRALDNCRTLLFRIVALHGFSPSGHHALRRGVPPVRVE